VILLGINWKPIFQWWKSKSSSKWMWWIGAIIDITLQ